MVKAKIFIYILFIFSIIPAIFEGKLFTDIETFIKVVFIYWFFSILYHGLRFISRTGNTNIDYGISYSMSMALFAGPVGVLIYEFVYRFIVFFIRKITKTADPDEFVHTFYNIGAFALNSSIAFYLYYKLLPFFENILFGSWVLLFLLIGLLSLLSDLYLIILFFFLGDMKTFDDAIQFIKSRSLLEIVKTAITNGMLYYFLLELQWEMIIVFFLFNYVVNLSFLAQALSIQHKLERDKFKQMAYTDFLTNVPNRAFMAKVMADLSNSGEEIGIVVSDIDRFKRFNDQYNHAVGDQIIQHFAKTLKSYLTKDDYLFRSGGEEFTIFLRNREFQEMMELVEKMRKGFENQTVIVKFHSKKIAVSFTASFGLCYLKIEDVMSIEKGYLHADQLLIQSKQLGRNRLSAVNIAK